MENTKTRLVAALAELLWVATLLLLGSAMVYSADGVFAMWGLACSAAAAAATVSAVVTCAGTKVLERLSRVESELRRAGVATDVEDYLRQRD